jgi:hypothetical protein
MKCLMSFATVVLLVASCLGQGPFGFEKGMTRQQVVNMLGTKAVRDKQRPEPDTLILTTAPKPQPDIEGYILIFSPTAGLLKVMGYKSISGAVGVDLDVKLQQAFRAAASAITSKYGKPQGTVSPSGPGSLESLWIINPPANNVASIEVEIKALSYHPEHPDSREGYINIGYEFVGWNEYAAVRSVTR